MAVTVYRSTDASAPVLNGVAGSLISVLDGCLVDGYGAKAAAGWVSLDESVTNWRLYEAATGIKHKLALADTGTTEARPRGWETGTLIANVTLPFPTDAQMSGGTFLRKSATADATARVWVCVADGRTVYFFSYSVDTAGECNCFVFGEFYSYLTGDNYRTIIFGRDATGGTATQERSDILNTTAPGGFSGCYFPRSYTGLGGPITVGKHGDKAKSGAGWTAMSGGIPMPNGPDGGLYLSRVYLTDGNHTRGHMRGFYHFLHAPGDIADGDTFSGVGDFAGKTFLAIKTSRNDGIFCMETSNTWETN